MKKLPWERLDIGCWAMGAIDRAIDETIPYVQQRKAFGKPLIDIKNTRF